MSAGYAVLRSVERFRNRVFTLVTDAVRMPDGTEADRDYLHHVGAVGVVALDDEDRIVLVRQYRHALRAELWELPAGLIDVEGEPLVDAAARELAEEADLRAATWEKLADVHTSPGCSDERIRLFLARDLSEVPEHERHRRTFEEAGMTVHRVPVDEAVAMARRGEITNAACLIGVLMTAEALSRFK
jgi:8-oxo-dGDP phosphatase